LIILAIEEEKAPNIVYQRRLATASSSRYTWTLNVTKKIKMLTDNEIHYIKDDKLKFKAYVETLNEVIKNSSTPLTIGIYGEWGSGKTSLMRLTLNSYKREKSIKTVWFDAWKYDKVEDLRVALIYSIVKQIESNPKSSESLKVKASEFLKRINWMNLAKNVSKFGISLATPYLANLINRPNEDQSVSLKHNIENLIPDNIVNSFTLQSLNFLHEFEELYKNLVKKYIGENGTLVIFIDDLDRCLPNKVIDILESIKLFLNAPGTIFFIGIDREIVVKGIEAKYGKQRSSNSDWAKNYLDKIIQLPFRLPPLRTDTITTNFINSLYGVSPSMRTYAKIIAEVGTNPRTIKRVINNFELQTILCRKRALKINEAIIAKLIVLEFRWPNFYYDFLSLYNNSKLNIIQDIFNNPISERLSISAKYENDKDLLGFIAREPSLNSEIQDLDKYIHLSRDNKQLFSDFDQLMKSGKANLEILSYDSAIENFSEAIILNDTSPESYYYRSLAYLYIGDIENSIVDISFCKSYLSEDISNLIHFVKVLIDNKFYDQASVFNSEILSFNHLDRNGLLNAFHLSQFNQKSLVTLDDLCEYILKNGFDEEVFGFLSTLVSPPALNNKIIEVYKLSISHVKENYKLIQDCSDYYLKNHDIISAAGIYLIEGDLRMTQNLPGSAFKSYREATRVSKNNPIIINDINSKISEKMLSFEYVKYLFLELSNDESLILSIKKMMRFKANSNNNENWNSDFLVGEVEMYVDDKEYKQELLELLEDTSNNR